jgi:predicted ArsR family transcriptional regulator
MAKMTQTHKLYQILKNGDPVPVQKIAEDLGIHYYSVAVYIHELKKVFKANINSIRDGRKVKAYQLTNANKIKVPEFKKNTYMLPKAKAKPVVGFTDDLNDETSISTVSEKEFADIRSSLGLDFGFSGNTSGWD